MDVTLIVELISSVGFPIAAVIAMGLFILKIYKSSEAREQSLMEEIKENRTGVRFADKLKSLPKAIPQLSIVHC